MTTNGSGWIVIDPVDDKYAGEYFLLTAKTNLAAGTDVTIQTWPITDNPVNRSDASGGVGAGFHTPVMKGNAGENVITGVIDSRKFRPEPYFIVMFNDSAGVSACTWYNVSIAPEENPTISPSRSFNESGTLMDRNSSGSWIAIEPVPDTCLGDIIIISGSTNLPAGENLSLAIRTTDFHGCQKTIYPCYYPDTVNAVCCTGGFNRAVPIIPGMRGINTWSFAVNTSEYDFRPESYVVYAESEKTYGMQIFKMLEKQKPSGPWIAVDPVPHHYLGDTITFRGTTNLEPGELINIRISEGVATCAKCRERTDSVNGCCGDFNRMVVISQGVCGNNLWSLYVNTSYYDFHADEDYWIGMSGRNHRVGNSSFFTVSGIPRPNLTLNLPENDTGGFALRFSGRSNTGTGPDEKLLLTVSSDSGRGASFMVPVYWNGTGYSWNFTVNKSAIVPYNFLTVNVTSATSPAVRIERTFMYTNEPAYYPYNPVSP